MKKSRNIQSRRAEEAKARRTRKEDTVAALQNFAISQPSAKFDIFLFLFVLFPISPHVTMFILHNFVIYIDFVVYNTPKKTL